MNEIVKREESQVALPIERVLTAIISASSDSSVDVSKMRELLGLQKEMMAMQAEQRFHEALLRIQTRMPRIPKNGVVDLGGNRKYDFAKWEDMDSIVGPILQEEGFTVTFSEEGFDQYGIKWAASWRAFGHTEVNRITLPPDKGPGRNELQARGSTNSYAKRYLTEDFCKLVRAGADDDGVRGGTRYISEEKADELRDMIREVGRQEGPFLDRLFAGAIRSCDEIEEGGAYNAARGTLTAMKQQMAAKAKE